MSSRKENEGHLIQRVNRYVSTLGKCLVVKRHISRKRYPVVLHEAPQYLNQISFRAIRWQIFDNKAPFDPLWNMLNKFLCLLYRRIIKKDLCSFVQLLAQLFKAFSHHRSVNAPCDHVWDQGIMPCEKSSNIAPSVMR